MIVSDVENVDRLHYKKENHLRECALEFYYIYYLCSLSSFIYKLHAFNYKKKPTCDTCLVMIFINLKQKFFIFLINSKQ